MAEYDVDVFTLTVQVSPGTLQQVAADNGFDFVDGKWVVTGRQGSSDEAEVSNANGWMILRGVATVGCSEAAMLVCVMSTELWPNIRMTTESWPLLVVQKRKSA